MGDAPSGRLIQLVGSNLPLLVLVLWLVVLGALLWNRARLETEPPVWDTLTYSYKAHGFWKAVSLGKPFNPFAIEPTVRPPATVLVSYPFGYSDDFRPFYFRTLFIPAVLLAVAGWLAAKGSRGRHPDWLAAAVAMAFSSMPVTFQLQGGLLPAAVTWGLVDNFMTALAALAAAAALRAASGNSRVWAGTAGLLAVLGLWTKPTGVFLVVSVVAAWMCLVGSQAIGQRRFSGRQIQSGIVLLSIAALGSLVAVTGPYFSAQNRGVGRRALAVLRSVYSNDFDIPLIAKLIHSSFGWIVVAIIVIGTVTAVASKPARANALAAWCAILTGGIFWLYGANVGQVRYFMPFAAMAAILLVPVFLGCLGKLGRPARACAGCLLCLPGLGSSALLSAADPPQNLQRLLGINLTVGAMNRETRQAHELLSHAKRRGSRSPVVYICTLGTSLRGFQAVLDHDRAFNLSGVNAFTILPMNWTLGFAFRIQEIADSHFIACDGGQPAKAQSEPQAQSFEEESLLLHRWCRSLGPEQGVAVVSDSSLLVLEIVERDKFEQAVDRLASSNQLRAVSLKGYYKRWWQRADLGHSPGSDRRVGLAARMAAADGEPVLQFEAISLNSDGDDLVVDLWVRHFANSAAAHYAGWQLFCHLQVSAGQIGASAEVPLRRVGNFDDLYQYRLRFPGAGNLQPARIGFGSYRPAGDGRPASFLTTQGPGTDWDGRRIVVDLADMAREMTTRGAAHAEH